MTTSDAMELPAEGEVVLAWCADDEGKEMPWPEVYRLTDVWEVLESGEWYRAANQCVLRWVPLSLARKAWEMEAAAKAASVLESGATLCGLCYTVNFEHMTKLRAALRDAGMGGGA